MFETFIALLTFIAGIHFGVHHAKIKEMAQKLTEVKKKVEETPPPKESHVTIPSYFPPHQTKQTSQVINPKTPEQLTRESQEKLRQDLLTKQPIR